MPLQSRSGDALSASDYVLAMDGLHTESRRVIDFSGHYDVVITPTFPQVAPRIGTMGADPANAADEHPDWLNFTYSANCTG